MENKCIYCGRTDDLSESDIIPDALTNARILNKNVCRIEHNNKFSDMFESKVIKELAFITNELDIKSSKGKKYASYDAIVTIEGTDYDLSMHGDNEIFNGRVLKSADKSQMISSYEKAVKIAGDESKVQPLDVNHIEIEKRVRINNEIFFDASMYRMLAKIAFEWYCAKNNVIGYYQEFNEIVTFITTGRGENPVSIIQEAELYKILDKQVNLGSHTLFAFETSDGEIDVIVSLFGLLLYRIIVTKKKPACCKQNFLFTELRIDSSRKEIMHQSVAEAENCFFDFLNSNNFQEVINIGGLKILIQKQFENTSDIVLYPFLFNMIKCFDGIRNDAKVPNENVNKIILEQLKNIIQASTLQKKSIKRFVNEMFSEGHKPIQINPHTSNKKYTVLFYAIYLIGLSNEDELGDKVLQKILKEGFPCENDGKVIINDEMEIKLKNIILETENYSDILEKGANRVKNWNN